MILPTRRRTTSRLWLAAVTAASAFHPAMAQQPDSTKKGPLAIFSDTVVRYGLVPHTFTIAVGGFLFNTNSTARLSSPTSPGTGVDLEQQLGLASNNNSINVDAAVRLGKRQLVTFGYFGLSRNASRTLSGDIVFGDTVYQAGATIDASTGLQYLGFTYRYYIWRYTRWELGAGLGIDALKLSASLAINLSAAGKADSAQRSGSFTAPAPMLGLYGDWEFAPRFYARGTFQYFAINNVESYSGFVGDDRLAVEWYPLHNYGLGLMYHYVTLSVTKSFSNGDELKYQYTLQGPAMYLTAAF